MIFTFYVSFSARLLRNALERLKEKYDLQDLRILKGKGASAMDTACGFIK